MDKTQRKIAHELLHSQGVALAHTAHELYRIAHINRAGLTEKEYRFLMARHAAISNEMEKVGKLRKRLEINGRD